MPGLNITINQGELRGCSNTTVQGFKFNSFLGIPYAKPPLGDLRFKDPLPGEKWTGVRDATKEGAINAQHDRMIYRKFVGSEDSLFINVHVPENISDGTKLPVMVWIHGGAFQCGSGDRILYGADHMIQNNVIIVTLNYRLGMLGFLCLHTPEAPGNAGLKDQVMALKWVRDNIEHFGGDKDNVTIFGESAGSASVNLMMLSPVASGLFKRSIMQSGSALSTWGVQKRPVESAFAFAKSLGFDFDNKEDLLKKLRELTPEEICAATQKGFDLTDKYFFAPVIEETHPGIEPFITKCPREILMSGNYNKVPTIIGFTNQEGVLFTTKQIYGDQDVNKFTSIEDFKIDFNSFVPSKVKELGPDVEKAFIDKIKNFYFLPNVHPAEGIINLYTDTFFCLDIQQFVQAAYQTCNPLYYYQFSYNGNLNILKRLTSYNYKGSSHADELLYLFNPNLEQIIQSISHFKKEEVVVNDLDKLTIYRMTLMWTNFAKYGVPIPETSSILPCKWEPVTEGNMNFLNIGNEITLEQNPLKERMEFWAQMMQQ